MELWTLCGHCFAYSASLCITSNIASGSPAIQIRTPKPGSLLPAPDNAAATTACRTLASCDSQWTPLRSTQWTPAAYSWVFYDLLWFQSGVLLLISSATLFRPFQHLNFWTLWDTLRSQEQFTCVAACLTCHCQICSIWKKRCPWNISAVASPAGWASLAYICVCNSLRLELIFLMAFVFQLMALHLMLGEVLASLVSKDYKESRDMNVLPRGCVASTMIH